MCLYTIWSKVSLYQTVYSYRRRRLDTARHRCLLEQYSINTERRSKFGFFFKNHLAYVILNSQLGRSHVKYVNNIPLFLRMHNTFFLQKGNNTRATQVKNSIEGLSFGWLITSGHFVCCLILK